MEETEKTPNLEQPLTTSEKRLIKINNLKARIEKETARLNTKLRKERNGQLVALGILGEMLYIQASGEDRLQLVAKAGKFLSGRNLERVLGAFKRLEQKDKDKKMK